MSAHLKKLGIVLAVTLLAACQANVGMHFPVTPAAQEADASLAAVDIVRVTPENIRAVSEVPDDTGSPSKATGLDPMSYAYRVGPGDVLSVTLWDDPARAGQPSGDGAGGLTVSDEGTIFYPFVGQLRVSGKTVTEIRNNLTSALSDYLQSPQVDVTIAAFNAHHATLVGAVSTPGRVPLSNIPLTLIDALNRTGLAEDADLSSVILRRGGRDYAIDVAEFIDSGSMRQNPVLRSGDVVIVETPDPGSVYTFGEIGVGEITLGARDMSLTSLIAQRGGLDKLRADARGVFVFRAQPGSERLSVYQFALEEPSMLVLAQAFSMRDGDVLFVTQDPIVRWNDTVSKVLSPVVTTIRAQAVVEAVNN